MKCFTNSLKCGGPADPAEKKAVMFALLSCFLFIGFLTIVTRSAPRRGKPGPKVVVPVAAPLPPMPPTPVAEHPPDLNSRFRVVPSNFREIDFATRSYGTYRLSNETNRDLVLVDGQFRDFGDSSHWFDLDDVFYTDLTGDGSPEAIVMMTHLECGSKCDGGKNLLYVYSQDSPLNEILKYESGSGMEGCSLKSLAVKNRQLTLELFGRCPLAADTSREFIRHETYDVTRVEFFFNGKKLVPKNKTFLAVPDTSEVSYGVDVRINGERTPLAKQPVKN